MEAIDIHDNTTMTTTPILAHLHKSLLHKVAKRYPWVHKIWLTQNIIWERAQDDLDDIAERINTGEYLLRNFSKKRRFDVSGRMQEFYLYLESYTQVGKSWKSIFETIWLRDDQRVLNLCPGWSPKVELGLYYNGFSGSVDVCDIDKQSAGHIRNFMRIFDHHFHIYQKTKNVLTDSLWSYEVIVGNHIIDDLVVGDYVAQNRLSLEDFYKNEDGIKGYTQDMQAKEQWEIQKSLIQTLADQIDTHLTSGGYVVLNHYKSYVDDLLANDAWYRHIGKLMKLLKANLCARWYQMCAPQTKLPSLFFPKSMYFILKK